MRKIYLILLALMPFTVFAQCSVGITSPDSIICSGSTVTLYAIISGYDSTNAGDSAATSFVWKYNTTTVDTNSNQLIATPTATTKYYVTANFKSGCSATDSITVSVTNGATPTFTTTGCASSDTLSINGAVGGSYYEWYKNDTLLAATSSSYVATTPGAYTASATYVGCSYSFGPVFYSPATDSLILTINKSDSTLSVALAYSDSMQWYKNGAPIPGAYGNFYNADSTGNYKLAVHSYGCSFFSDTVNVTIVPPPVITSSGTPACSGSDTLKVKSLGANIAYIWYNNGNQVAITYDSFYVAHYSGNYTVNLYDSLTTVSTYTSGYEVTGLPLQLGGTATIGIFSPCGGDSAILQVPYFNNTTYQWSKSGVSLSGQTNVMLGVMSSGAYSCTITFSNNGCTYTYDTTITLHTRPVATLSRNATGDSLIANVSGGVPPYNYQWYGVYYQSSTSNRLFLNDTIGGYNVVVTDSLGCTGTSPSYNVYQDTVSGTVYNSGLSPVASVPVYVVVLHSDNSTAVLDSTITDAYGNFSMTTIATNGYFLAAPAAGSGYLPTYDSSAAVVQDAFDISFSGGASGVPIVLINTAQSAGSGQISGVIDSSALGNARQGLVFRTASVGAAPIAGLKIILLNANNQPVATTTTDANGFFQFTNLATGNYKLWVDGYGIDNTTAPVVTVGSGTSSSSTNLQLALSGTSLRVTGVTGITSATTNNGVSVYPNPASSSLNVSVSGFQSNAFSYVLSDSQGNQITKGQGTSTIDVSGMEPGLYILSVQTAQTVTNQKVIIER